MNRVLQGISIPSSETVNVEVPARGTPRKSGCGFGLQTDDRLHGWHSLVSPAYRLYPINEVIPHSSGPISLEKTESPSA